MWAPACRAKACDQPLFWRRDTGLAASRIKEIVDALQEHFLITEGIGLELHPENVNVEVLRILKDAGVTKISIGIQSFCDKYQKILGRKTVDTAGDAGGFGGGPV